MTTIIIFFRRWGWLIAFVLGAVTIFVLTGGKVRLPVAKELEATKRAADAEAKAAKLQAQIGHVEATKKIEEEYRETIEKLDERQKQEAEQLRKNPRELSRMLARNAAGRGPR